MILRAHLAAEALRGELELCCTSSFFPSIGCMFIYTAHESVVTTVEHGVAKETDVCVCVFGIDDMH